MATYQDLENDYTEVDTAGYLTLATTKATALNLSSTAAYVYKDFDADHFDALDIDFEIYSNSNSLAYHYWGIGLSDVVGTVENWGSTDPSVFIDWRRADTVWIWLVRGVPFTTFDYWNGAIDDTPYYCTMSREAGNDTIYLHIFDDSGRANEVDTLEVSGYSTDKWQYFYGFAENNVTYTADSDGYVDKIDLNEAVAGTNFQINIGDTWKEVTAIKINIGDVWKSVTGAWINISDTWKKIF